MNTSKRTISLEFMVVPLCYGVTLTGSDNGYYYKLPEGLFSLASDNADDDLLPKAFRVTPFFYVASKPRVFNHLFFDDGGKPAAFPLF